eukprot:6218568-Prymnesium_polylepis.1
MTRLTLTCSALFARLGFPSLISPGQIAVALRAAIAAGVSYLSAGGDLVRARRQGPGRPSSVLSLPVVHCLSRLSCRRLITLQK